MKNDYKRKSVLKYYSNFSWNNITLKIVSLKAAISLSKHKTCGVIVVMLVQFYN